MKKQFFGALVAAASIALLPQTTFAQQAPADIPGAVVPGIGVANLEGALVNSAAVRNGATARQTTYKPQIDQARTRAQALQAQLNPLIDKFQRDRQAPNANQAALQQQATVIQQMQENGQNEINTILRPVAYSEQYVVEMVEDKLDDAVRSAMSRRKMTLLLQPGAVMARSNAYDITADITAELDRIIPNVTITPPQGWEPRQLREARAAQAAQAGQAAPTAPAPTPAKPSGR